MFIAQLVGEIRNRRSHRAGQKHIAGLVSDGVSEHFIGACGEFVFCIAFGIWWDKSIGRFKGHGADILEHGIQIRTRSRDYYELNIRPGDLKEDPNYRWVLITMCEGDFVIRGWIWGYEAEKLGRWENLANRPAVLLIAQLDLHSILDLKL